MTVIVNEDPSWAGWAWDMGPADRYIVEKYWPQSADLTDDELGSLLISAKVQCEAYAPSLATTVANPDGTTTTTYSGAPVHYVHAQVLQARALYRSSMAGNNDQLGVMDGMTVTVFPMDWTVKNLLRPKKGGLWIR